MSALAPVTTTETTVFGRDEACAFVRSALSRAPLGLRALSVPVPTGRPLALLERALRAHAFYVQDETRTLTTLGATRLARPSGRDRFEQAAEAFERARATLRVDALDPTLHAPPVWTFGFAFAPGRTDDLWRPLGDGQLTLPRWTHRVEHGRASLTLVVDRDEPSGAQLALAELEAIWDALESRAHESPVVSATARHVDRDRWTRTLDDALARIDVGELEKVVVARRSTITGERDLDPIGALTRLRRPGAIRFCARHAGVTFVGATPERLFHKRGGRVRTEAVAGTSSVELDPHGAQLLESEKDRHEHRFVVDAIRRRLERTGGSVSIGATSVRTIGSVAHLVTPIDARVAPGIDAFDLLAALHPTPAVGGVPREGALAWIDAHEPDRGWYAGPIGWIDANGDADAFVALRSAIVSGSRAQAYAGCGVVRGSSADAEYAETALKLAPMLAALGVAP